MGWFQTGRSAIDQAEETLRAARGVDRFWLRVGDKAHKVLFIDGAGVDTFSFKEHQFRVGNDRFNESCSEDGCLVCAKFGPSSARYHIAHTVVDVSGYVDKKQVTHDHVMRLHVGGLKVGKRLIELENRNIEDGLGCGLEGVMYMAARHTKQDPNVGDTYDRASKPNTEGRPWVIDLKNLSLTEGLLPKVRYQDKFLLDIFKEIDDGGEEAFAKWSKIFKLHVDPENDGRVRREIPVFNYEAILKPRSQEQLARLLSGAEMGDYDQKQGGPTASPHSDGADY